MFEMLRSALICIRDVVSICFMCRSMDQLPGDNIGKAANDYWNCITNKCCGCCNTDEEAPNVELIGANNVDSAPGQV